MILLHPNTPHYSLQPGPLNDSATTTIIQNPSQSLVQTATLPIQTILLTPLKTPAPFFSQ